MITVIKDIHDNIITYTTNSFISSTYVIINNDPKLQFGVSVSEEEYHRRIRIKAIKSNETIVRGTVLNVQSKYPINEFKKD